MAEGKKLNPIIEERLFFTPIWETKLDITDKDIQDVYDIRTKFPNSEMVSNSGGWQSTKFTDQDAMPPLLQTVKDYVDDVNYSFGYRTKTVLHQYWYNINGYGDFNYTHHHGYRGRWSSVLYLKTPENGGKIIFERGDPGRGMYYDVDDSNEYNFTRYYFDPYPGMLIIFPCWLEHLVEQSTAEDDRITIAVNFGGECYKP